MSRRHQGRARRKSFHSLMERLEDRRLLTTYTVDRTDDGMLIPGTLTLRQAILAAKAGASFISPFLGRLDDIGENGLILLQNIIEIYQNYSWKTEVLAASLRHPIHVIEAARMGADIATMPFKVIDQLFNHPLTDKGQAQFLADWAKRK